MGKTIKFNEKDITSILRKLIKEYEVSQILDVPSMYLTLSEIINKLKGVGVHDRDKILDTLEDVINAATDYHDEVNFYLHDGTTDVDHSEIKQLMLNQRNS